jgi:NADPH:quinone reductase-like Zn-dependent oxidoreductase
LSKPALNKSVFRFTERVGEKNMPNPILVTGAAGRVGAVGRTVTELLLKEGKAVRAMVRNEDERAQALRDMGAEVVVGNLLHLGGQLPNGVGKFDATQRLLPSSNTFNKTENS